ncbi:hypothetical protein BH23THE1_BH23THE1_05240 [soil metagenome]
MATTNITSNGLPIDPKQICIFWIRDLETKLMDGKVTADKCLKIEKEIHLTISSRNY